MASTPFTVSKMLENLNAVVAPYASDTKIELKRKMDNGIMLDTSSNEIAYLDTQAKVKCAAQAVACMTSHEKKTWIHRQKQVAKQLFDDKKFQDAADMYIQMLTALDFGQTEHEKKLCQQQFQLPLTCNLIACMLQTEQWDKARQMTDQVLQIDSCHIKARQQRAKALMRMKQFQAARLDVIHAIENGEPDEDQLHQLNHQLRDIERAEEVDKRFTRKHTAFEKQMVHRAVGKLYADKPTTLYAQANAAATNGRRIWPPISWPSFVVLLLSLVVGVTIRFMFWWTARG